MVRKVSPKLRAPIVLFQYYNPILRKGPDEYCRMARDAGAAGTALFTSCTLCLRDIKKELTGDTLLQAS